MVGGDDMGSYRMGFDELSGQICFTHSDIGCYLLGFGVSMTINVQFFNTSCFEVFAFHTVALDVITTC